MTSRKNRPKLTGAATPPIRSYEHLGGESFSNTVYDEIRTSIRVTAVYSLRSGADEVERCPYEIWYLRAEL